MRLVWEMAQTGEPLDEEENQLVRVMREHPEYADLWGQLDELPDEEIERDGMSPILHIIIHQTVENQIASKNPPEAEQAVEALMQQGLSRHEAIHRIGAVLSEEIYYILRDDRPFDVESYARKLRLLVEKKDKPRRRFWKGWRRRG